MSVIFVLLTISLSVAVLFFIGFILSVRNGQYDDSYTPSVRMLFEDELVKPGGPKNGSASGKDDEKPKNEKSKKTGFSSAKFGATKDKYA